MKGINTPIANLQDIPLLRDIPMNTTPITDLAEISPVYNLPVMTEATDINYGPVLIGIIIIGIFIGLVLFLISQNQTYPPEQIKGNKNLTVTNKTSQEYNLTLPNMKQLQLYPEGSVLLNLGFNEVLRASAVNEDGTINDFTRHINSDKNVTDIFITNDGLLTNLSSSSNVKFINQSPAPITIVQKAANGKRWYNCSLNPYEEISNRFVGQNSTWEVVIQNRPVAQLTISGIPSVLIFNGYQFKALR